MLAFRALYIFHLGFNSDEPQHAHVLWMVRLGQTHYRDFFDNHAPLFYMLWAPITRLLPRDTSAMFWLRASMLPIYLASLYCTYRLARALFTRRTALWMTGLLAVWPAYYELTVGFRPDQLWATFWLAAVAVAVGGIGGMKRALAVGFLLGAEMMVSFKTAPLVLCLLIAAVMTRLIFRRKWQAPGMRGLAVVAGFFAVPAVVFAIVARQGALDQMYACTVGYNVAPGVGLQHLAIAKLVVFVACAAIVVTVARRWAHGKRPGAALRRRTFVLCLTFLAIGAMHGLWPIFEPQDWLPLRPLMVVSAVGGVLVLRKKIVRARPQFRIDLAGLSLMAGAIMFVLIAAPYKDSTVIWRRSVDQVCRLVEPGESVIDLKGEFLFFPRALTTVYETLSRGALKSGRLVDDGPEQIEKHPAYVAPETEPRFPMRTRQFLRENFVSLDAVAVAGKCLGEMQPGQSVQFQIRLPEMYDAITPAGPATGTLDGAPIAGPVYLGVGDHVIHSDKQQSIILVWHRAVERGQAIDWKRAVQR